MTGAGATTINEENDPNAPCSEASRTLSLLQRAARRKLKLVQAKKAPPRK